MPRTERDRVQNRDIGRRGRIIRRGTTHIVHGIHDEPDWPGPVLKQDD